MKYSQSKSVKACLAIYFAVLIIFFVYLALFTDFTDFVMNGNFVVERDTAADLIFLNVNRSLYAMPLDITYANNMHMTVDNIQNGVDGSLDFTLTSNGSIIYQKNLSMPAIYRNGYYDGGPGNGPKGHVRGADYYRE